MFLDTEDIVTVKEGVRQFYMGSFEFIAFHLLSPGYLL